MRDDRPSSGVSYDPQKGYVTVSDEGPTTVVLSTLPHSPPSLWQISIAGTDFGGLVPACGDIDSLALPSAPDQGDHWASICFCNGYPVGRRAA
jgi:hypothetical protein